MDVLRRQHTTPRSAAGLEFDALTDDSTDEERQSLAERYAPEMRRELQEPRLQEFTDQVVAGTVEPRAWSVLLQASRSCTTPPRSTCSSARTPFWVCDLDATTRGTGRKERRRRPVPREQRCRTTA